jgi:Undecaprenyl-phosphate glucose phosphotransferase
MRLIVTLINVGIAFVLAYLARFQNLQVPDFYQSGLLFGLLLCALIFPATGVYRAEFRLEIFRRIRRVMAAWSVVVMLLIGTATVLKVSADYSRIWFGYWVIFTPIILLASEIIQQTLSRQATRRSGFRRKIVLAGSGAAAAQVEQRILADPVGDLEISARFGNTWSGHPALPISGLTAYLREENISEVWISVPWEDKNLLEEILAALSDSTVDVNVVPDLFQYRLLNQGIIERNGLPVINLCGSPMTGPELGLKAAMDRIFAVSLTLALAPILIVLALLVRISSRGPVFFRQRRHGIGGEPIDIIKFRTMVLHRELGDSLTQAQRGDERVTLIGRFLRRTSLDELPQLFNVLRGEMSLVGPRPHAVQHNDFYKHRIPRYMLRHKVKPGITGWAQVNGHRGQTETEGKMLARVEHDLWYIQNWSLWLDIKILLLTPLVLLFDKNAY